MGPYHHFHPQLYKMEGVKLAAAKSVLQRFNIPDWDSFLQKLRPLIPRIRACYDGATIGAADLCAPELLEWAMAVDGLFLLSLICDEILLRDLVESAAGPWLCLDSPRKLTPWRKFLSVGDDLGKLLWRAFHPRSTTNSDDEHRRQLDHLLMISAVVNDAVLLENQVPISILVEAVAPFRPDVRQLVAGHVHRLCTFLSPVPLAVTRISSTLLPAAHLLEHIHLNITVGDCDGEPPGAAGIDHDVRGYFLTSTELNNIYRRLLQMILRSHIAVDSIAFGARMCGAVLLSAAKISSFGLLDYFIPGTPRNEARSNLTATQLAQVGLRFEPKSSSTRTAGVTIDFHEETQTIAVPVFRWHPYSGVVTRNLVAYEAAAASSSAANGDNDAPLFAQYVNLLRMVARTRRDVELLIERGVIVIINNAVDPVVASTGRTSISHTLVRFFRSMGLPPGSTKRQREQAAGGVLVAESKAHAAVRRYYNSRPKVVARRTVVALGYVFAMLVLLAAEAMAAWIVVCGLLKTFSGCTTGGGQSSCTSNGTATLMSVVVPGTGGGGSSFHLDA